jgi:tetratricopeptide (TPR) repeat protein
MGDWSIAHRLATIVLTGTVAASMAHAQNRANNSATLSAVMVSLQQAGKYAEATDVAKRVLAITEKARRPKHRELGSALNNLAELYRVQNRYGEAEPLFKRSLTLREKVLG